jgi:hypothetical protein
MRAAAPPTVAEPRGGATDRRRRRLVGLPPDLQLLAGAFLVFAAATLLLGALKGLPLMPPTEGASPALGVPAALPVVAAAAGYVLVRSVLGARAGGPPRIGPGGGRAAFLQPLTLDLAYLLAFVVVGWLHFHVKTWMPLLRPRLFDATYFAVDEHLAGLIAAADLARAGLARLLPAPDLWYQGAQVTLVVLSFWLHALGDRRWHHHNVTALLLVLMIGPFAYLVAPAVGPFLFQEGPNAVATASQHAMYQVFQKVQAGGPAWLARHGGENLTAALAAMPSLHVSLACVVSYYALRARSAFVPLILFLSGWIFLESVVSRWHYLVDLPPGVALAALAIALANRACRWRVAAVAAAVAR